MIETLLVLVIILLLFMSAAIRSLYRHLVPNSTLAKYKKYSISEIALFVDENTRQLYVSVGTTRGRTAPVVVVNLDDDMSTKVARFFSVGVVTDIVNKGLPPFEF